MTSPREPASGALIVRAMAGFYENLAQPLAWFLLRVCVGGALVVEGWPKLLAPLAQSGFVESLGFHP